MHLFFLRLCSEKQHLCLSLLVFLSHLLDGCLSLSSALLAPSRKKPLLFPFWQQHLERGFLLSGLSSGLKGRRNRSCSLKITGMGDIIHECLRGPAPPLPPTADPQSRLPPTPHPILALLRTNQHVPSQWLWNFPRLSESQHCLPGSVSCMGLLIVIFANWILLSNPHGCPRMCGSKKMPGLLSPPHTLRCQVPPRIWV